MVPSVSSDPLTSLASTQVKMWIINDMRTYLRAMNKPVDLVDGLVVECEDGLLVAPHDERGRQVLRHDVQPRHVQRGVGPVAPHLKRNQSKIKNT